MKTLLSCIKLLAIGLILFTVANAHAQKKQKKVKIYKVWVKLNDEVKEKGFLYEADSNTLKVINTKSLNKKSKISIFEVKDINKIYLKRNGKGWRSTLIGTLGTAVAVELIMISGDGESGYLPNEAVAVLSGIFLGAPIGALVGTGRNKFDIYGNEALFKSLNLEQYAMVKSE